MPKKLSKLGVIHGLSRMLTTTSARARPRLPPALCVQPTDELATGIEAIERETDEQPGSGLAADGRGKHQPAHDRTANSTGPSQTAASAHNSASGCRETIADLIQVGEHRGDKQHHGEQQQRGERTFAKCGDDQSQLRMAMPGRPGNRQRVTRDEQPQEVAAHENGGAVAKHLSLSCDGLRPADRGNSTTILVIAVGHGRGRARRWFARAEGGLEQSIAKLAIQFVQIAAEVGGGRFEFGAGGGQLAFEVIELLRSDSISSRQAVAVTTR